MRSNNCSAAAITDVPFDVMPSHFAVNRRLGQFIDDPGMDVSFPLNFGEGFLIDSTPVQHVRKGCSGAGTRWLQGCYADMDCVRLTLAALLGRRPEAAE